MSRGPQVPKDRRGQRVRTVFKALPVPLDHKVPLAFRVRPELKAFKVPRGLGVPLVFRATPA